MKNIIKFFSLIVVLLVAVTACQDEDSWYDDYNGSGDAYVQLMSEDFNFGIFTDAEGNLVTPDVFAIGVKIVGPVQNSDVTVGLRVTSSTGDNGEWNISSMTTTIPAGSLSSSFTMNVSKENTVIDSVYMVEIELDGTTSTLPVLETFGNAADIAVKKGLSCLWDQSAVVGSWHSLSNSWAVEGDIELIADDDDPTVFYVTGLEEMEGLVEDQGPLMFKVNPDPLEPNVYEVTCDRQVLVSDLSPWGVDYTNLAYAGSGLYYSCEDRFVLDLEISVDQGTWGAQDFLWTKN